MSIKILKLIILNFTYVHTNEQARITLHLRPYLLCFTGVWFIHYHFDFHLSMGLAAVFIVEDGPTVDTSLPAPPVDFPTCGHDGTVMPDECYLKTKKSEDLSVKEV